LGLSASYNAPLGPV